MNSCVQWCVKWLVNGKDTDLYGLTLVTEEMTIIKDYFISLLILWYIILIYYSPPLLEDVDTTNV